MNKKNKSKNRSKPSNPVPTQQKIESASTVDEPTVTVGEKQENKVIESESVVEATSEVTVPVTEESNLTGDTPKKPKRNKGKKKKQGDSELDETKSGIRDASPSVLSTDTDKVIKDEGISEATEAKIEEEKKIEDNITPNVRKKKNKKKSNEQSKVQEPAQDIESSESLKDSVKIEEKDFSVKSEPVTEKPATSEILEPETKQSKKKNKKKNHRHDSEKSDKVDETISCTAAFQKLASLTDNEDTTKSKETLQPSASVTEENKDLGISPAEETLKDLIESVILPEEMQAPETESMKNEPPKGKKKNKKDKKQHIQQVVEKTNVLLDSQTKKQEVGTAGIENASLQDSTIDAASEDKDLLTAESIEPLTETETKSKAKIAKPVDKKRKSKQEPREVNDNVLPEYHDTEHDKGKVAEPSKENQNIDIIRELPEASSQNIEKSPAYRKKDDKSTGVDLTVLPKSLISEESTTSPIVPQFSENILSLPTVEDSIKFEDIKSEIISEEELLSKNKDTEISEVPPTSLIEEINKDSSGDLGVFKTVEKKKKKHPKKIDIAGTLIDTTPEHKILITPDTEPLKETPEKQKEEISFDLPSAGDVEISSIKTDDMEGSSDVTPDFIHHPLATSQQLIDDNNNMFIQEVTSMDEKLTLPILIATEPVVQGSGETPDPEKILMEPHIVPRDRSKTNEPEKTDLKSKMMEVNQDMEELRLSIERSLAELTSMEKTENEIEKRFEKSDNPNLGIVTEPIVCTVKSDQLLDEKKSINESIMKESISPSFIKDNIDQTQLLTENMELKTEELKYMSDKSEVIKSGIVEQVTKVKSEDEKIFGDVKDTPPIAPTRKDHKGKGKSKRKGKQETQSTQSQQSSSTSVAESSSATATQAASQESKKEEKAEQRSQQPNENKGKQQQLENGCSSDSTLHDSSTNMVDLSFEPIEKFEDALTSSVDDVNKTFEMIANDVNDTPEITFQNPEINIIAPTEDTEAAKPKQNPVSPPKNLLGHPDIPVPSNRTDYKKEKNKPPNMRQAKVKIKDSMDIEKNEKTKQSKESQTENKRKLSNTKNVLESFSYMTNENAEYVYKYSFRKVFLQNLCHVCRKEIVQRVPCQFCSLVFYCSQKHKEEDWPQHQALCFAVCTIVHLKDQKHIYNDAKHITGHNYRLLRMQMIVSCEKVLKRKLVPWEQEALLYPRICADVACREWKQSKLADCEGCGQISYCSDQPEHLPSSHQRWCRSYALYQKLVQHQQTKGRLEPKLPTKVMAQGYKIPEKINEVLASMYDEKIDMTDTEYAALTQLATAPLTAAYCHQQAAMNNANGLSKKSTFVIHIVGAELQFEADVLHKWEVFFLHLKPDVKELKVVLVSPDLNPFNLPLDLLGKVNLCDSCRTQNRGVLFSFQDKKSYYEYWSSDEFFNPDIVCTFNPSVQRSSMYNGKDTWPTTISCILKLKTPFIITSYSINELQRDIVRIKECSELAGVTFKTLSDPKSNPFASVRPDRNFITDDEIPLLFKNYCFAVLCGV